MYKKIALQHKFIFFMQNVFDIVYKMKIKTNAKKQRKQPRKYKTTKILDEEKFKIFENEFASSNLNCIVVASCT